MAIKWFCTHCAFAYISTSKHMVMAESCFFMARVFLLSPYCHELFARAGFYPSDVVLSIYWIVNINAIILSNKVE